jgi:hypothetical protein
MRFALSLSLSLSRFLELFERVFAIPLLSHAFHEMSSLSFRRLKMECEKLATEKIEIQRHYVMVSAIAAATS